MIVDDQVLHRIWDITTDAIVIADAAGTVLAANTAYGRLVGQACEALIGQDFALAFPEEQRAMLRTGFQRAFTEDPPGTIYEVQLERQDGSRVPVEVRVDFSTEGDRRVAMIGILRDTTARSILKEMLAASEARIRTEHAFFEAVLQHLPAGVLIVSAPDGAVRFQNERLAAILGIVPEALSDLQSLLAGADVLANVLQDGVMVADAELTLRRADGPGATLRASAVPLRDASGCISAAVLTFADISAQKQSDQERRALERKLLETQKLESLGVLAGGIAHDFNNLLMAILGNLDLALLETSPLSRGHAALTRIGVAAQQAVELTRQMLAYAGRGRLMVETLDLNTVIVEMAHLLRASIGRHAALSYQLGANLMPVEGDTAQIRQVVLNLVTNAAEAVGDGPGTITVATSQREIDAPTLAAFTHPHEAVPGRYVCLEIADTGVGMDDTTLQRIFEPFFTTKFTGRGLGLAAVLGIVRSHRGALHVQSRPGAGTTMTLMFPPAASFARPAVQRAPATPAVVPSLAGLTVLVIDDEEHVREVVRELLDVLDCTVYVAADGPTGLAIAQERVGELDCVLLDLTMPGMNGDAVLARLKQVAPRVPVVLMSGYSSAEINHRFEGRGLAGFLQKPFTIQDLASSLKLIDAF